MRNVFVGFIIIAILRRSNCFRTSVVYHQNLMMNVIKALNQAHLDDPSDIKPSQENVGEATLLFGKRPNPAQVKKEIQYGGVILVKVKNQGLLEITQKP